MLGGWIRRASSGRVNCRIFHHEFRGNRTRSCRAFQSTKEIQLKAGSEGQDEHGKSIALANLGVLYPINVEPNQKYHFCLAHLFYGTLESN